MLAAGMAWKLLDFFFGGGGAFFNIIGVLPGNKW